MTAIAKTAAQRNAEYRKRRQENKGQERVEAWLPRETLEEARGLATMQGLPLREFLSRHLLIGLRAQGTATNNEDAIQTFVDGEPGLFDMLDTEAATTGEHRLSHLVLGLIGDGLKYRNQARSIQPEENKRKRGRPSKKDAVTSKS